MTDNFYDMTPVEIAIFVATKMDFFVFPADPATKKPYIKAWQDNASKDPAVIRAFWEMNPKAMIAVVTGHKSGICVIDIDIIDGRNSDDLYKVFSNSIGGLPKTMAVCTPSGGLHLYYAMPDDRDLRNSAKKIGEGVDVRANGGYVIFAGSKRADGKMYTFLKGASNV